jgi:hypothetical protein
MTIKTPDRQGKWKTWLPILFFITGFGFLYLGWNAELSALIYIGLLPIGLAVTWWGVIAIQTKESSYSSGDQDSTITYSFAGLAAIADGGLLVLVGVLAVGFGVVGLLGVGLVVLGLISIVLGGLELVSPRYFQLLLSTVRDALLPGS